MGFHSTDPTPSVHNYYDTHTNISRGTYLSNFYVLTTVTGTFVIFHLYFFTVAASEKQNYLVG